MSIHSSSDERFDFFFTQSGSVCRLNQPLFTKKSEEDISSDEEEDSLSSSSSRSPSLSPAPPSIGQKRNIANVKSFTEQYEQQDDGSEDEEDRGLAISIKRKKVSVTETTEEDDSPTRPSIVRAGTVAATNLKQSNLFGTPKDEQPVKR